MESNEIVNQRHKRARIDRDFHLDQLIPTSEANSEPLFTPGLIEDIGSNHRPRLAPPPHPHEPREQEMKTPNALIPVWINESMDGWIRNEKGTPRLRSRPIMKHCNRPPDQSTNDFEAKDWFWYG